MSKTQKPLLNNKTPHKANKKKIYYTTFATTVGQKYIENISIHNRINEHIIIGTKYL
jgi:hypothetical protein